MPFTVARDGEDVPALLWLPERPRRRRPLVLFGHGGGMHKESPLIERLGTASAWGVLGAIVGWVIGLAVIVLLWQRSASCFFRDPSRF